MTVGEVDEVARGLRLTWLGHACVVIDVAGHRIITDPLLGRHAGLLRRRGAAPDPAAWQGSDIVLVSHLHHDHAELSSLRRLADRTVLAAGANARWLRGRGVTGAVTISPEHSWTSPDGRLRIEATHAVHAERPMPHRPNAACGFTVTCDDPAVPVLWFAGDTERFATMSSIRGAGQRPIDLAVVPVGGWGPRLSGGHMDPADAARAVEMVGARWAVPVHWGTLHPPAVASRPRGWMDRPGPAFVAAVGRLASGCTPVSLEVGQGATFADVPRR